MGLRVISQTVEYALRAVVDLSYHGGEARTTQQIAEATMVPAGYLAKILKELSRKGLVRSQRGLHGGFMLDRDPRQMTVYDVIAAVDPPKRILSCPLGLEAHRHQLCPLHQRLDDAMAMAERAFRETTIAEVTADPTRQPLGNVKRSELTISGGLLPVGGKSKLRRSK
ncbi:MAG TPA: Rrf2 family transcriptional regulator [Phycisphaerales bacterium]|nr:Rrf2 family transcriptional regulator [Phycisphaerales bacterium]